MDVNSPSENLTFEEVYPKAEFSELIRLSLSLCNLALGLRARLKLRSAPSLPAQPQL